MSGIFVKSWQKRRNYNPRKQLLRGVPWDYRLLNLKNITSDILSRKSLVKYLSSIYIPTFPPWFPAFPPWFPAFPPWSPAFPPWFPVFPPWFLCPHPDSPHSHPDSLHSHPDSQCSHLSPHSAPWFSILAFTNSLFLQRTHSDSFCEVACKYWNIFTDNQLS